MPRLLYVNAEYVRNVVEQPAQDTAKRHSFELKRSGILSMGNGQLREKQTSALEIKAANGTHHFCWLPNEADVQTGRPCQFRNPPQSKDPVTY